jgi:hypothetical protein
MDSTSEQVENFLEMERILNLFFDEVNYCLDHCIKNELIKSNNQPVTACCQDKYYEKFDLDTPGFFLLRKKREELFGRPEDIKREVTVSPCEYHGPHGCMLKTHKSPVCIGFMCRKSIDYIREKFQIFEYDYLGIYYALEWILSGDLSGKALEDFKSSCEAMVQKAKKVNRNE